MSNTRNKRNSIYGASSNSVLEIMKKKIKEAERQDQLPYYDPATSGCMFQSEQVLLNRKIKRIRKVYMIDDKYKVGWVVDSDMPFCMICLKDFNWFKLKHHCRACGQLVCNSCSPYSTTIPTLEEDGGSRVCVNCFGLKPGLFTPVKGKGDIPSPTGTPDGHVQHHAFHAEGTVRRPVSTRAQDFTEIDVMDKAQEPKYEEAHR